MLRSFLLSLVCFVAGYIASLLVHVNSIQNTATVNTTLAQQTESQTAPLQSNSDPLSTNSSIPSTENKPSRAEKILAVTKFKTAKTAYDTYQQLFALNALSEDELKEALTGTSPDKKIQRANIVWMLATKFPENALALTEELTKKGEGDLARTAISSLAQVKPKEAWAWVKGNDALLEKIIPNLGQRYEFKLDTLRQLAQDPASKWEAYEEAQTMVATGPKKADSFVLRNFAQTIAESDPDEALNRALAGTNGKKDAVLLNGVISVLTQNNILRAKEIIEMNPELVESYQISKISDYFLTENRFNEAYEFANSFKDEKQRSTVQFLLGTSLLNNGQDRVLDLIKTIKSNEDKSSLVSSLVNIMGANGAPPLDRIKLMDDTISNIPSSIKAFQYANILKDLRSSSPTEYNTYMEGLRARNRVFAEEVDYSVALLTKSK